MNKNKHFVVFFDFIFIYSNADLKIFKVTDNTSVAFELLKCFFRVRKETEQKEREVKENRFVSSVTGFWDSLAALPAYNCF